MNTNPAVRVWLLGAGALVAVAAVAVVGIQLVSDRGAQEPVAAPTPTLPGSVSTDSPVDAEATAAAIETATEVVAAMYSFDFTSGGPNAWLEQVRDQLTSDAYDYYRQALGPGDGPTTTPFWTQLVAAQGEQVVTPSNVHVDGESAATNTTEHLTVLVPYTVTSKGFHSPLQDTDRLFYVNLDSRAGTWLVSAVISPTALPSGYGTYQAAPLPSNGSN